MKLRKGEIKLYTQALAGLIMVVCVICFTGWAVQDYTANWGSYGSTEIYREADGHQYLKTFAHTITIIHLEGCDHSSHQLSR